MNDGYIKNSKDRYLITATETSKTITYIKTQQITVNHYSV